MRDIREVIIIEGSVPEMRYITTETSLKSRKIRLLSRWCLVFECTIIFGIICAFYSVTYTPDRRKNVVDWSGSSGNTHRGISEVSPNSSRPHTRLLSSAIDAQKLFYNRVPKCGSTTLIQLLRILSKRNKFVFRHSTIFNQRVLNESQQVKMVEFIKNMPSPSCIDRHLYFINFTRFGELSPLYFNNIRDPVERTISAFYYRRISARLRKGNYTDAWYNKDFESCVKTSDSECTALWRENILYQISFFCGHEEYCRMQNNSDALQQAKRNIETYYAAVGLLEHMDISLQVFEKVVPTFFSGVHDLYRKLAPHENVSDNKRYVSEGIKAMLRKVFASEYELYEFARQRLFRQYRTLVLDLRT